MAGLTRFCLSGWLLAGLLAMGVTGVGRVLATDGGEGARTAPEVADAVAGKARIETLRKEIARHDELYFRKAAPVISDFEYDRLKAELRALEARFPEVSAGASEQVGDDRSGRAGTFQHTVPMLSLEKVYTDAEVEAFAARVREKLGRSAAYRVEPKYDGVAVSLVYERGRLVRALTRGNGREGDDITTNVRALGVLPDQLGGKDWPERVELRGEIYLPLAEFARMNAERESAGLEVFANPRNVAAGAIRLTDTSEMRTRRLALVCYGWGEWMPAAARPKTLGEARAWMAAWGLPVVEGERVAARGRDLNALVAEVRKVSEAEGFPADGVVLKLERVADQDELGLGPTAPRWAVARKFEPERVATRLLGITWQVGRTGLVSPVAELSPVELGGSTIARATLHNADEIMRRDIRVGDRVWIEKAGEIIPAIASVDLTGREDESQPYGIPDTCPGCAGRLTRTEDAAALRCENRACPAQVARRLEHLASPQALDIRGLGPELIKTLVATKKACGPAELCRLTAADLAGVPGVSPAAAEKLAAAVAEGREKATSDGARLLYGLSFPGVGQGAAKKLAAAAGGFDELADVAEATLGERAGRELFKYLKRDDVAAELRALAGQGLGKWRMQAGALNGPLRGEIVVVTGAFSRWTRPELVKKMEAAGARVAPDVTRQTTLVVAGEGPGATLAKARARGVAVIDEAELARRLAPAGAADATAGQTADAPR